MLEVIVDFDEFDITPREPNRIGVHERVVRCKDCKHYESLGLSQGWLSVCMRGTCMMLTNSEGFCAWGERREDD